MMKKLISLMAVLTAVCSLQLRAGDDKDGWRPYLTRQDLPNGALYLPPPPDTASLSFLSDWAQHNWGKSVRSTPRGERAAEEAHSSPKWMARFFSPSFGYEISKTDTPAIYELLHRTVNTASEATQLAKKHHMRKRPYVQFGEGTLVPEEEESHRRTGSYPSSHSSIGWAAALVLAELNPAAQDAILQFGYEYGQSRVIAGYHYQSDVDAARVAASACVARLHADPAFQRDLKKAKREFSRLAVRRK